MATYYTSSLATGSGTGTFANPWTLQQAFDNAIAGDEVRVLNDGTYLPTTRIDIDTNRGTSATATINYYGRKSDDTAYEMATISGASIVGTALINFGFSSGATNSFLRFHDLRFTASPSGQDLFASSGSFYMRNNAFVRCRFDNAGRYGFSGGFTNFFNRCVFDANSNLHLYSTANSFFVGCFFRGSARIFSAASSIFCYCVFTGSGDFYSNAPTAIINCTFDGKGSIARIIQSTGEQTFYVNNIIANYTSTAIYGGTGNLPKLSGNLFYNNGTNTNLSPIEDNSVTGDPVWTNTTTGSEDYSLQPTSAAIGAAQPGAIPHPTTSGNVGYATMGALIPQTSGGTSRPRNPFTQGVIG